ncbi:hypothetical protein ACWKSP_22005 [Micromonosporaceae bacterium Da 78-11]
MSMFSRLLGDRPAPPPLPYAPTSPEGLAARWVRWIAGIGSARSPIADDSGLNADLHQPDDVWFLAGTFGEDVQRHCTVPAGRPLFFPVFNMWHRHADGPPSPMSHAFGRLLVDDVPVAVDTIATPVPFAVHGTRLNPVTWSGKSVPVTVWGLWKQLDPLTRGQHVVQFSGGDGYGFTVKVTYHLTVA